MKLPPWISVAGLFLSHFSLARAENQTLHTTHNFNRDWKFLIDDANETSSIEEPAKVAPITTKVLDIKPVFSYTMKPGFIPVLPMATP